MQVLSSHQWENQRHANSRGHHPLVPRTSPQIMPMKEKEMSDRQEEEIKKMDFFEWAIKFMLLWKRGGRKIARSVEESWEIKTLRRHQATTGSSFHLTRSLPADWDSRQTCAYGLSRAHFQGCTAKTTMWIFFKFIPLVCIHTFLFFSLKRLETGVAVERTMQRTMQSLIWRTLRTKATTFHKVSYFLRGQD